MQAIPPQRVLVVGQGGREHALCHTLHKSPYCKKLFCAPGNGGISQIATCLPIDMMDNMAIVDICHQHGITFVIIGNDAPLANGVVDALMAEGIDVFGPTQAAARIESSKVFMKDMCAQANVPTGQYQFFTNSGDAVTHVRRHGAPLVIKADGLTMGKGVTPCATVNEAIEAIRQTMDLRTYGPGGTSVIIEEFLEGEELSFFAILDGTGCIVPLTAAQDHKRAYDGDIGPNTGGMGAYSPVPWFTAAHQQEVLAHIVIPIDAALRANNAPFCGFLYVGLMKTPSGFRVIEFNARFGDPEAQCILPRLTSDLLPLLWLAAKGQLAKASAPNFSPESCITVTMATKGYPGQVENGSHVGGISAAASLPGSLVFHAATCLTPEGIYTAHGGRVLNITGLGPTLDDAHYTAYQAVAKIDWPEGFYRHDIGHRAHNLEYSSPPTGSHAPRHSR
ncbi:MAG: phosphoribosylamine--glycine ligase [Pseudomonadaceae bacterium]|nr:phosphoribosylamine--glycine ligase [Pseudomonadaceae bacterium]